MTMPLVPAETPSRRDAPRLRLGVRARLQTLFGLQHVKLLDVSEGGAQLLLPDSTPFKDGVLFWFQFEAFGSVTWQHGRLLGFQFHEPLPLRWLVQTRHRAPFVVREEAIDARAEAKAWVNGRYAV